MEPEGSSRYSQVPAICLCGLLDSVMNTERGYAVTLLVEALRYKPEGLGFDSR